ncbi:MAG: 3-methyl-2-oxobutanoate hydroxymethyltransferase, partial [Candidatus Cloacimonadaceae bacterium]|nr:3-methyl-2-oxobutanoate hydroxymethyltransferase [Candidatus Cloacimonadaceae bacterium]
MIKNKDTAISVNSFAKMKDSGKKIVMMTAYDYTMARCVAKTDIDLILVGDSLGMVVLGYENTLKVTIEDMVYHCAAVRRGASDSFIIADMPYMSYHQNDTQTRINASRLIIEGMANAIKLEGGSPSRLDAIRAIVDCEIPVCAHLGLTPQSVQRFGGYKVQGKTNTEYETIMNQALEIQAAGAFMLVLEGIPELLGKDISKALHIPTIGIGAGRYTDGQVLVYHDLLGYSGLSFKFVKQYANLEQDITKALSEYANEVRSGAFPHLE